MSDNNIRTPLPTVKDLIRGVEAFKLSKIPTACAADAMFSDAAEVFCTYIRRLFDVEAKIVAAAADVTFIFDPDLSEEEYRISAKGGTVSVFASDIAGASHGASVVLQMICVEDGVLSLGEFTAHDKPDTEWRGLMIDLARATYPFSDLLKYADLCYFARLRQLHFHFTDGDDEMYKLPSELYPALPGKNAYTKEQIDELRRYLAARGIMIVPEIEMPAHSTPLSHRCPESFGPGHLDLICVGHEGSLEAFDALVGEICDMFPEAPYIHIGGDEAAHRFWGDCPDCVAYMERNGLEGTHELYTHLVRLGTEMVLRRGRTPIVWEGFPEKGTEKLSREVVVMVFQSTYQDAAKLTAQGFKVINTSWIPMYVVPSGKRWCKPEEIYQWTHTRWHLENDMTWEHPIDIEDKAMSLGAELCVWESYTFETDGEIVCRNLPALAERTWNVKRAMDYAPYAVLASAWRERLKPLIG